jgi:hypothetical protein
MPIAERASLTTSSAEWLATIESLVYSWGTYPIVR